MSVNAPHGTAGSSPAQYASELVRWAGDDPQRLAEAIRAGNGKTLNCVLRRLTVEQLRASQEVLAQGEPMPFSTQPYGVWEINRELAKR